MTTNELLLIALILLQVGDAHSTLTILKQGGREANPVMQFAFTLFGSPLNAFIVKGIGVAVLGYFVLLPGPTIIIAMLVLIYAAVVTNNYRQIK